MRVCGQACALVLRVRMRMTLAMSLSGADGRCWMGFMAPPLCVDRVCHTHNRASCCAWCLLCVPRLRLVAATHCRPHGAVGSGVKLKTWSLTVASSADEGWKGLALVRDVCEAACCVRLATSCRLH